MGERKMADISVMDAERLCGWLPRRARETHKGDFGRILLLCGAVGYTALRHWLPWRRRGPAQD